MVSQGFPWIFWDHENSKIRSIFPVFFTNLAINPVKRLLLGPSFELLENRWVPLICRVRKSVNIFAVFQNICLIEIWAGSSRIITLLNHRRHSVHRQLAMIRKWRYVKILPKEDCQTPGYPPAFWIRQEKVLIRTTWQKIVQKLTWNSKFNGFQKVC